MRPLRLYIEGFTSFRAAEDVDFSDLDLFAITGPTGAGKSSLVDAMTYALFGQVPRVGRNIKELISQGQERLKVGFEFAKEGQRYRIFRSTATKGLPQVQLERFDFGSEEWVPEEDRVEEATRRIEELLGLDYEGFTRSVLLPQGQFQQFVAGKPEERRKVLDEILRLDIYQRMLEAANRLHKSAEENADRIADLLSSQFADATPDNLRQARQELQRLKKVSAQITQLEGALDVALQGAEGLSEASRRRSEAAYRLEKAEIQLAEASSILTTGQQQLAEIAGRLEEIDAAIGVNRFDPDLLTRLNIARASAEELVRSQCREADLRQQTATNEDALRQTEAEVKSAQRGAEMASAAYQQAQPPWRRYGASTRRPSFVVALRRVTPALSAARRLTRCLSSPTFLWRKPKKLSSRRTLKRR